MVENKSAFTLLEIVVVMIIIAVLASIALPQYGKTVNRSLEDSVILNLKSIHANNEVYRSRSGGYFPADVGGVDLSTINDELGLSIISNDTVYSCSGPVDGSAYTCTGVIHSGQGNEFTVRLTEADLAAGGNPCCNAGDCPNPDNQC